MRKTYALLAVMIVLVTVFALYGQHAVYRYPALAYDPAPRSSTLALHSGVRLEAVGAYLKEASEARFRAYQPDVTLRVSSAGQGAKQVVRLENIHPEAIFRVEGDSTVQVVEHASGLLREVELLQLSPNESFTLSWIFPQKPAYKFVAMGDTGGDRELSWGLIRASELGADFILHLGDAYYHESELGGAVGMRLNQAKVPVYTANGNHDFRGPKGNSIELFLKNIGPLNARFELLGHCFINLDTGAYMYPAHKGERGGLLAAEIVNHHRDPGRCADYIVFTHKPMVVNFETEFPDRDHALHRYDARWIIKQLQQLGTVTVIAGHIHTDFDFAQDKIKTFVTGSGLAHIDLIRGGHYARLLVGEFRAGQPLQTEWMLNAMPLNYHCSEKVFQALKRANNPQAQIIQDACSENP